MATKPRQWNIRGKTVLITGGTGGIGYQTARALASSGAQVVITGRDAARVRTPPPPSGRGSGADSAIFIQAEHSTVGGNRQLAGQIREAFAGLGVLINNVGGLYETRWETTDGYEATLAMNFVGPFALTAELLPLLEASAPARCINVVSAAIRRYGDDPFGDSATSSPKRASSAPSPAPRPSCSTCCSPWPATVRLTILGARAERAGRQGDKDPESGDNWPGLRAASAGKPDQPCGLSPAQRGRAPLPTSLGWALSRPGCLMGG